MGINKTSWILIGTMVWGLPTGIIISLAFTIISPQTFPDLQSFESEVFIQRLYLFAPIFMFLGIFVGLFLHQLAEKYKT